jgi:tRNA dimethylallyltransferase
MPEVLVICGPTGCGKTDFAHKFAFDKNCEIVNCDSMQIYSEIPILTASPSDELKSQVPYHLYNFQSVELEFSLAKYTQLAADKIHQISARGNLPVIVGGTGMYINALLYGYNNIPEISGVIRNEARALHSGIGQESFFKLLVEQDPSIITKISPNDTQRSLRAYEVYKQTGQSIFTFQNEKNTLPLAGFDFKVIFLNPARDLLYNICNQRLIDIFNNGAIEEAKSLRRNFMSIDTPAAKAIGFKELISYLNSECSFADSLAMAQQRTRNYAKRQITWFKHQLKDSEVLEYSSLEEFNQIKNDFSLQ